MSLSTKPPTISVIVEWENVLLAEQRRARLMLAELHRQATQWMVQSPALELLILFDPAEADSADVQQAVADCIPANSIAISWRLVPAVGTTYYRMKNLGAQQ